MGPYFDNYFHEFTNDTADAEVAKALELDSSLSLENVKDVTFAEAGRWVVEEMANLDLSNRDDIKARINVSNELLLDLKACALWPVAAHAHMQVVKSLPLFLFVNYCFTGGPKLLSPLRGWAVS